MLRRLLCISLCLPALAAAASTHTWPTDVDCAGSLQTCVSSTAANGDTVLIASNGPINESVEISKPLTLTAAPGYRPVFAAGHYIRGYDIPAVGGNWSMTISGLTLLGGDVGVRAYHDNPTITLRDLVVTVTGSTYIGGGIAIDYFPVSDTPAALNFEIANNLVTMAANGQAGIYATADRTSTPADVVTMNGAVHDNRIDFAPGAQGNGMLFASSASPSHVRVFANDVRNGINVIARNELTTDFLSNAIACAAGNTGTALSLVPFAGAPTARVFNNTLVGCDTGMYIGSGLSSLRLTNNVIAFNAHDFSFNSGVQTIISNDHNLLYANASAHPLFTPGAGTITSDPRLRDGTFNPRLNADSPAIDAGNTADLAALLASAGIAQLDADGSRRIKGTGNAVDIGAYEFGDATFLHRVNNADPGADDFSYLDDASINGDATRYAQITANWNPDGTVGIYDNQPVSINYDSVSLLDRWYLRAENLVAFHDGARYNVFAPAHGNGSYRHLTTAGNVSGYTTMLDDPDLTDHADRILLVTRDSTDAGGTVYDDTHPFSVFYFGLSAPRHWFISHNDSTNMGVGGGYHVYFQEPSLNAFVHRANAVNSAGDSTFLDHPLLNGQPCARFQITQSEGGGVFNPHHVGVWYNGARWAIFNEDLAAMPLNAEFHVVIDGQQLFECSTDVIFADGFD